MHFRIYKLGAFATLTITFAASCSSSKKLRHGIVMEKGNASYYAAKFEGRTTANGEIYHANALTAAHKKLPFGTIVLVTNLLNSKSVSVRINDRGPFVAGRDIDLSYRAAQAIDMIKVGLANVTLEYKYEKNAAQ